MAVKLIDLQLLYGVAGAREKFEDLSSLLIKAEQPKADKVRVSRGDGGIDVHVGDLTSPDGIEVFQCKFFPHGLDDSQKGQIRESFKTCRTSFKLKRWTLCLPLDLSAEEKVWFETWRKSQDEHGVVIADVWGATTLENLLYQPKNQGLREAFFREEHLAQIREMHNALPRLAMDIVARLKEETAAEVRVAETQARQIEYLESFTKSIREGFKAVTKPPPRSISDQYDAVNSGNKQRVIELNDAHRRPDHWEFLISPSRMPDKPLLPSLKDCLAVVEACQTWYSNAQFPFADASCQEAGHDWLGMRLRMGSKALTWRLSQYGVFGQLMAIFDDLQPRPVPDHRWASRIPRGFTPDRFLDIDIAVRTITLNFRFAARLTEKLYPSAVDTVDIRIMLTGTRNRVLVTRDDPSRLHGCYVASAPALEQIWPCNRADLIAHPDALAVKAAVWFFERFSWPQVAEQTIAVVQQKMLPRE